MDVGPLVRPEIDIIGVVSKISCRGVREKWEQAYIRIMSPTPACTRAAVYVRVFKAAPILLIGRYAMLTIPTSHCAITYFRMLNEQVRRPLNSTA
jgi:hypothetical protein